MREINEIIVHCTATRPEWWATRSTNQKVAEVRRWHVEQKDWRDIGYHFLIDRDGKIAEGRHVSEAGAHVRGRNADTIGIALFGGHGSSETDRFADNFTVEQDDALVELISELKREHGSLKVAGHNEYAAKACPGFNVHEWAKGYRKEPEKKPLKPPRTSPMQSTTIQASTVTTAAGVAGTILAALSQMDPTVQMIIATGFVIVTLASVWIMRERLKSWAAGRR